MSQDRRYHPQPPRQRGPLHTPLPLAATVAMTALGCTTAAPASRGEAGAQTRATLDALVDGREAPGIAYLVVDATGPLMQLQAGTVDAAVGKPITDSSMFMAYSMTKALTAIAVMQLVQVGRLELDAAVTQYLPSMPYGDGVTVGMLLSHTAGVPNPAPLDWFFVEGDPIDRDAALQRVLRDNPELDAEPGEEYGYSNVGYWLLETLIEAVTGEDYAKYVQRELFARLRVTADDATFSLPPRNRLATGHIRQLTLENLVLQILAPDRYFLDARDGWTRLARVECLGRGYGGAYVTARALGAVLSDLLRPDPVLLQADTRARMFEPQRLSDGETLETTLGWVTGALHGVHYVGKQGGGLGFQGNLRIYPELGIATVYLANATAVTTGPIDAVSDRLDAPMVRWLAARRATR